MDFDTIEINLVLVFVSLSIDIKLLHLLGSLYYLGAWAVGILCNHLKWGLVGPYDDASITKYALGGGQGWILDTF